MLGTIREPENVVLRRFRFEIEHPDVPVTLVIPTEFTVIEACSGLETVYQRYRWTPG